MEITIKVEMRVRVDLLQALKMLLMVICWWPVMVGLVL